MNDCKQWLEEWLALFPKEVKSGGLSIRTDIKWIVTKMPKFCKQHPQYDKTCIFAATRLYLQEQAVKDYKYTKRAVYFIDKQQEGSLLAEYCQRIVDEGVAPVELDCYPTDDFI